MRLSSNFFLVALGFCASPLLAYGEDAIHPGLYITEQGWGKLHIEENVDERRFWIDALGANGHRCELGGMISAGIGEASDSDPACRIEFVVHKDGIEVQPQSDSCRQYCGQRASFDGRYLAVDAACLPPAVEQKRAEFLDAYRRKAYGKARELLEPVLQTCTKTLHWYDQHMMMNDLALTLHHLRDDAACRAVLRPLVPLAQKDDQEIRRETAPLEADLLVEIARNTRTNLKLCKAVSTRGRQR